MKDLEQAKTLVSKAKAQLVVGHPFFAAILLRRPLIWTEDVPTLAVDARARIYANPSFVVKQSVPQIVWALAHECMHVMFMHATRQGHRNHKKWNVAGDAVINDTLTSTNVGTPIPNCVDMKGSKDKTTEQVYDELPDNSGEPDFDDLMPGDGPGQKGQAPLTEAEVKEIEAQIKVEIAQAAQAAKMQGKMHGSLQRWVEDILTVKTPWYDILERFMNERAANDYSWCHPNRRFVGQGTYLPSLHSEAAMGTMVLQIDESGSIGQRELEHFGGHLNRILETCKPRRLIVLHVDTQVAKVEELTMDDLPVKLQGFGGGGTDMPAGFRWLDEQGIAPDCFVCLTDGYTPWAEDPGYPVLWAITTDVKAPWGETIHVEIDE